jgi:hypothetical protein
MSATVTVTAPAAAMPPAAAQGTLRDWVAYLAAIIH